MENSVDIVRWIVELLIPIVTAVVGYFVGKKKRDNDFLSELQHSIDLLSEKNAQLIRETISLNETVVALRKENAELKNEVSLLREENKALTADVSSLREQLNGIKTITRVKKND